MLELPDPEPSDAELVEAWRLQVLIDAGYPGEIAEQLAARGDIDLHQASDLIARGCSAATARYILL